MKTYDCSFWAERDRLNLTLSEDGREVFSLWDEAVTEAIEDGFLTTPRFASSDSAWLPHAIDYAREQGLIE